MLNLFIFWLFTDLTSILIDKTSVKSLKVWFTSLNLRNISYLGPISLWSYITLTQFRMSGPKRLPYQFFHSKF